MTSRLVRTRFGRHESRAAKLRGTASSSRSPRLRLPSMCHVRGDQHEAQPSRCCSGRRWRGKKTHTVEVLFEENRGVAMGSDATLQNVGKIRARPRNVKVDKSNDAICEETGRRRRVSHCRSAYFAGPGDYSL